MANSLADLLLVDLQETGVYDLAASVGIVQNGRLQESGTAEDAHDWAPSHGNSPLQQITADQARQPAPVLRHRIDPAERTAADAAVAGCLAAADSAAVSLRLASLQLEQWTLADTDASGAGTTAAAAAAAAVGVPNAALPHGDGLASPLGRRGQADGQQADTPGGAAAKRKRSGRAGAGAAAAAAAAAAVAAALGGDDAGGRQAGGIGGLRHFSLKVCEKVESKGDTSYEEVANELIADLAAEVAAGLEQQQHDEKNIRRRAYDALNVLEAIGMITKNKKAISWIGWPSGLGRSNEERLRAERAKALARLEEKRQALQDAVHKAYCLCNLAVRNGDAPLPAVLEMQDAGMPAPNPLMLPFMLVRADQDAEVEVTISEDHLMAHLDFQHWPFVLYDDDRVMRLMSLHQPQPQMQAQLQQQQAQQQEQKVEEQPEQQQVQQQQRHLSLPPLAPRCIVAGAPPSLHQNQQQHQHQPQSAGLHPEQRRQQQEEEEPEVSAAPRLTPSRAASGRLPTPALQLSPALVGSPHMAAAGLGSTVLPVEASGLLGSAQGQAAHHSAVAHGSQQAQQAQQAQQERALPLLRPSAAAVAAEAAGRAAGGVPLKAEAFGLGSGPLQMAGQAEGELRQAHMQAQAVLQPAGGPQWGGAVPNGHPQIPQLRPAAEGGWPMGHRTAPHLHPYQQQQQQQQQQTSVVAPLLQPARLPQ